MESRGQKVILDISLQEASFSQTDELFSIDRYGNVNRMTQFTDKKVDIQSYTWSPNGKSIAFWYSTAPDDGIYRLGILDVASGQIKPQCMNVQIQNYGIIYPPRWSPNSDALLINGVIENRDIEGGYHVVLLNLVQSSYFDLGNNLVARGLVIR